MGQITLDLLRRRAGANGAPLGALRELALHGQGLERGAELLGRACRRLRVLHLQNNLLASTEGLHRLKELECLNLAVNNVRAVAGLGRCESLRRLDLTLNFVGPRALRGACADLRSCEGLRELCLLGNPCAKWRGCRAYIAAALPQLAALDGAAISAAERAAAAAALPALEAELDAMPEEAAAEGDEEELQLSVLEPGARDAGAEAPAPWTPATRVREHRAAEARAAAAERAAAAARARLLAGDAGPPRRPRREALPPLGDAEPRARNEGGWAFSADISADGRAVVVEVHLERGLDLAAVQADVQPRALRVLARGRLLELPLPAEVRAEAAVARRSRATGRLVVTAPVDAGAVAPRRARRAGAGAAGAPPRAAVEPAAAGGDALDPPDLCC
jgi:protein TilB